MFYSTFCQKSKRHGFTLLEMIIVISIVSILMATALPGFTLMTKNTRLSNSVNELAASLYFARSEALKRGARVVVCKSSNGAACTTDGDWEQGWIVFEDTDNSISVDANEAILKIKTAMPNHVTMINTGLLADYISYQATGAVATQSGSLQSGTIAVCDDRTGDAAQGIGKHLVLISSGRFRIDSDENC